MGKEILAIGLNPGQCCSQLELENDDWKIRRPENSKTERQVQVFTSDLVLVKNRIAKKAPWYSLSPGIPESASVPDF
jgi:hypothetical protein